MLKAEWSGSDACPVRRGSWAQVSLAPACLCCPLPSTTASRGTIHPSLLKVWQHHLLGASCYSLQQTVIFSFFVVYTTVPM